MLRADRRFVVSHVGSMVRPPAMIPYLQKQQAGGPYDQSAFAACLAESVSEAVRLQAEAGIDVVSDGEYGKSVTWAFYVHRRLSGIEWRPLPIMREWAHEVRELGNEGTHPRPGTTGTSEKDAKDVVEFLSFLMTVMYNLPKQIDEYRKRKI
jgi:methionine synthase II (cobalamin-independent)